MDEEKRIQTLHDIKRLAELIGEQHESNEEYTRRITNAFDQLYRTLESEIVNGGFSSIADNIRSHPAQSRMVQGGENRMEMKPGDILFFSDKGVLSRTISLVSTGKFNQKAPSHVAIIRYVNPEEVIVTEAHLFKGVQEASLGAYENSSMWHARLKDPRAIKFGLLWLDKQVGKKYDKMQIVGIFARSFFRLFGKKVYQKVKFVRNFLDSKTKFICSELTEKFSDETGMRMWHGDIGLVTPYDQFRSEQLMFEQKKEGP